jgi:hypothetical protein
LSFFGEVDNVTLLEENAKFVLDLEEEQARKLLGVYSDVRDRLIAKIKRFRGEFTGQQARIILIQVEESIRILQGRLTDMVGAGTEKMLVASVKQLRREIDAFSVMFTGARQLLPLDALRIALDEKTLLMNQYATSLALYSDDVRQRVSTGLLEGLATRATGEQIVQSMGSFWSNEEWRLRRVVRTELHNVHGRGKLAGMEAVRNEFLPELKKTLYHPKDHRTGDDSEWLMAHPLVAEVDKPFRYEWPLGSGKWRVFDAPPDRPNDRAIVIPYQALWD